MKDLHHAKNLEQNLHPLSLKDKKTINREGREEIRRARRNIILRALSRLRV